MKMLRIYRALPILLLWLVMPLNAYAQSGDPVSKEPGPLNSCVESEEGGGGFGGGGSEGECNCREEHKGYLLSVIVPCIREQVKDATLEMTGEFKDYLHGIVYAFLTLVITIFGVQVLMAEGDPKKDAFILLVKIGGVIAFLNFYDEIMILPAFSAMQEGVEITTAAFDLNSEECQEYIDKYPEAEKPWIEYDCVLGKLMGFGPEIFVGASALGLAGAALWSGQFGMIFFMGALAGIFFILKLIIRGCYTYLMAVMALGFLLFISPLLIPLIWLPATQQYFDRWLNAVISMIVMPALVMGYLTLAFLVLNEVVFDEEMGIAKLLTKEDAQEMQMGKEAANSQQFVTDRYNVDRSAGRTTTDEDLQDPSQRDIITGVFAGQADSNMFNRFYTMDFRSDEAGTAGKLFFGFVALILVCYLLLAMLDQLIQLAQVMLGGGFFMQSAVEGNPFETALGSVHQTMRGSFTGSGSGPLGRAANFGIDGVKGMASVPGAFMSALGDQMGQRR